jgi:hypothetical protein
MRRYKARTATGLGIADPRSRAADQHPLANRMNGPT